jgi:hypothetical protein
MQVFADLVKPFLLYSRPAHSFRRAFFSLAPARRIPFSVLLLASGGIAPETGEGNAPSVAITPPVQTGSPKPSNGRA